MVDVPTNDGPGASSEEWPACLERTRRGVLDVLIGTAVVIAAGGWLLHGHVPRGDRHKLRIYHYVSLTILAVLAVASQWARRSAHRRVRDAAPEQRTSVFYRWHVISAALAGLAAPLGVFHGWFASAELGEVAPFWACALALALLAFPRAHELDDLDPPPGPRHEGTAA